LRRAGACGAPHLPLFVAIHATRRTRPPAANLTHPKPYFSI
jgi:hypothetical protein